MATYQEILSKYILLQNPTTRDITQQISRGKTLTEINGITHHRDECYSKLLQLQNGQLSDLTVFEQSNLLSKLTNEIRLCNTYLGNTFRDAITDEILSEITKHQ